MRKILLVDDDVNITMSLARFFRKDGWEVVIAGGVQEAGASVPNVDVVVTDYDMPGGGGEAVIATCAEHRKPVVVLTGNDSVTYRHTVFKPASFFVLQEAIEKAMASI